MYVYKYSGKNRNGEKIKGTVVAKTEAEALQSLQNSEITVKKIKVSKGKGLLDMSFGSVKFKDKIIFLKYLSTVLKSGLTVKRSLDLLGSRVKNKYFGKIINEIRESIENGQSFSESLKRYPRVFSPLFVNIIAAGEVSGNLANVISYLRNLLEKDYKFKRTIKGAMAYPFVVLMLVVSVTIGLVKFIIPKVTEIFSTFDVQLPLITRALIGFEKWLNQYWLLAILAVIAMIVVYVALMRIRSIRKLRDLFFTKIPFLGNLVKQIQVTRFTHTNSILVMSGIGMVDSIKITAETINNLVYKDSFKEAASYVQSGGDLSDFFDKYPKLYEPMIGQMIKLGESTGSIDEIMEVLSDLFEEEVNSKIKLISTLLGPILLIVMGLFVGGVAISIITPIYQLPTLIQGNGS